MSVYCEGISETNIDRAFDEISSRGGTFCVPVGSGMAHVKANFVLDDPDDIGKLHAALMDHEYVNFVIGNRDAIKKHAGTIEKLERLRTL